MVAQTRQPTPEWLNIQDAAAYVGVHEGTIRRYIATGVLQAYRRGPRILFFKRVDLDALMQPVKR